MFKLIEREGKDGVPIIEMQEIITPEPSCRIIKKPLKCINAGCVSSCDLATMSYVGGNPEKCIYFKKKTYFDGYKEGYKKGIEDSIRRIMEVNLNDKVQVVLTQYGADWLNNKNSEIGKKFPRYGYDSHYEGEIYNTQLWCLFEEFGELIHMTCAKLPFKDNKITFI